VRLPNGAWRIYVDGTWEAKFYYADSTDGLKSFSPLHELPYLSGTVRHGTVIADN
jgi:hypothetical protein